ncbi:unnamed protein product, partial [marine sediment metagenome]
IGKIKTKFFDSLIDGLHEHLIDEVTFYKAQKLLNLKSLGTYNIKYKNEFPLKRFLKCPNCNNNLTGSYSKGLSSKGSVTDFKSIFNLFSISLIVRLS